MDRRTWEDLGIGAGALALIGGGVYLLDKQGLIHLPHLGTSPSSTSLPTLNVAPQTLPSAVPVRCGTVYVSFGPSPHNSAYIMVGKYTNAKLVSQYYQPATANASFNTAGQYAGGYQCGNTSTGSGGSGSSGSQAANKGWIEHDGGAYYVAAPGATLSGLGVIVGKSYTTLAHYNCLSNPNAISIGQKVYTTQQSCGSSSGSGGSGSSTPTPNHNVYNIPNWTYMPPKCWKAESGANLSTLAAYLGLSVNSIVQYNHIANANVIQIGQTVCIG